MSSFTSGGRSEFVDLVRPLHDRLSHYDPTAPPTSQPKNDAADPAKAVPQSFIDAMIVREEVYVAEQNIALENELDEDDARSFHWVAYASLPSSAVTGAEKGGGEVKKASTKIPIGTIRLVPPPHAPHRQSGTAGEGRDSPQAHGEPTEAYIKLGRLAVIKEFRGAGISKLLIETALSFARQNPHEVGPQMDLTEALQKGVASNFKGLVLVHSQVGVQKVWKRYGFEKDEAMGTWDEEGIDHVGMWRRVDVQGGRRASKLWTTTGHS
ncbi:acetyltransferase like protein [Zymoseptoria brevis]|uniref:Acetyltransferase like protein n=1 Tax=Zymoseptoria brevis TaxID=1047168 RepID=A0A0F4GLS4_9PEZI|nr:acetyltransferase like protein [Zymoseptoria brevis]